MLQGFHIYTNVENATNSWSVKVQTYFKYSFRIPVCTVLFHKITPDIWCQFYFNLITFKVNVNDREIWYSRNDIHYFTD